MAPDSLVTLNIVMHPITTTATWTDMTSFATSVQFATLGVSWGTPRCMVNRFTLTFKCVSKHLPSFLHRYEVIHFFAPGYAMQSDTPTSPLSPHVNPLPPSYHHPTETP